MATRKGNKETKKAKKPSDGTKKEKKDPKRHDGPQIPQISSEILDKL